MGNQIEIDVTANETASDKLGNVADASKNVEKVVVNSMGTTEAAFDTAARGSGKLGDALDKTEGATGKLGEGVSGVSDVIDSFNSISNHGAEKQRALARAQIDVEQAANDAKQAVEDYNQAQRDGAQAGIDAKQAQIDEEQALKDAADAQRQYNEDVKEHGKNSAEAKQDLIDLKQAQLDQQQATEDGKQAQRDANQATIDAKQALTDQKSAAVDLSEAQSNLASQNSTLGKIADYTNLFGSALSGLSAVIGLVTVAQWAWNAAQLASPTTWIILGIVALVAIIVLVATKTKFFQTIWEAVWGFFKMVGAWFAGPFADFFVKAWHIIWDAAKVAAKWIIDAWNNVLDFFKGIGHWFSGPFANFFKNAWKGITLAFKIAKDYALSALNSIVQKGINLVNFFANAPGKIAGKLRNMFNPIWQGFRSMINNVIRGWNSLHFTVPGFSFLGLSVPSFTLGVPNLPYIAKGGDVLKSGLAFIHQGERVLDTATTQQYDRTRQQPPMHAEPHIIHVILSWDDIPRGGDRIMDIIHEGIRAEVKSQGGGNVQVAYGRGSAS